MNVLKSVLGSDHGFIGLALIIGATVLCALGIMPLEQWQSYTEVIFGTFSGAHALISGANALANRSSSTVTIESSSVKSERLPATVGEIAVAAELKAARIATETQPEPPKAA